VAGVNINSGMRAQFSAIAQVRWQLFANSLRTVRGRLELVARGFMFLGYAILAFGGCAGLGVGAWYFVSHREGAWLAVLLWPVFLFWQFFPVLATAFSENTDSSNLLRFPLTFCSYVLIRIAFGSLEPATAIGILWSAGFVAGVVAAQPSLIFIATPVMLAFAILNILLGRMIYAWIERWLAQRRTRELLGVVFLLFIISFQFIGPLATRFERKGASPAVGRYAQQALPMQRFFPPGLAADSIASAFQNQAQRSLADLALLSVYSLVVLWLLNLRLRAQYRGENLGEASARKPKSTGKIVTAVGWNIPGVPGPVSAIVEKEFHYLSRSGPMLFTFVMPLVVLVMFRFTTTRSGASGGILAHASDLAFPVGAGYILLILTNLLYNSFGGDGVGVQLFFLSPVRFREILLGKNLAHAFVVGIEMILVFTAACFLYRPPSVAITVATICGVGFAFLVNVAAGNLLSMYSPKKIDFGTLGRQRASGTTQAASIGIQMAVIALCALAILVGRAQGKIWLATLIFLFLIAAAAVGYVLVLKRADGVALKRREAMISELSRA
jgi:ABC-2 type transport system permease protein